jgi:hypothetical protein
LDDAVQQGCPPDDWRENLERHRTVPEYRAGVDECEPLIVQRVFLDNDTKLLFASTYDGD